MNLDFLAQYALFAGAPLVRLTRLENQGYTNTNYLLESTKEHYLVRVFGKTSLNRSDEFKIGKKAFTKGIGQKPLLLDSAHQFMVIHFAKGAHCATPSQRQLQQLARTLRTLHGIRHYQKPYDVAKAHRASFGESFYTKRVLLFKKLRHFRYEPALCHHDLNPKNILFQEAAVRLIDWEYARVHDRYFDLASVIVEFGLGENASRFFLQNYVTCKEKIDHKKLALYKKIYQTLCQMWLEEYRQKGGKQR